MRLLSAADHRRMPWKNGGGVTTEIAVWPEEAGTGAFDWRVSMATVAADGPFSRFPGIDRTLSILTGGGLRLEITGREPAVLTRETPPLAFPADVATTAALLEGPVTDLNVMSRRGRIAHAVTRIALTAPSLRSVTAATSLLFCHAGRLRVQAQALAFDLNPGDALIDAARTAEAWLLVPDQEAHLFLIEFQPASG